MPASKHCFCSCLRRYSHVESGTIYSSAIATRSIRAGARSLDWNLWPMADNPHERNPERICHECESGQYPSYRPFILQRNFYGGKSQANHKFVECESELFRLARPRVSKPMLPRRKHLDEEVLLLHLDKLGVKLTV